MPWRQGQWLQLPGLCGPIGENGLWSAACLHLHLAHVQPVSAAGYCALTRHTAKGPAAQSPLGFFSKNHFHLLQFWICQQPVLLLALARPPIDVHAQSCRGGTARNQMLEIAMGEATLKDWGNDTLCSASFFRTGVQSEFNEMLF